MRTGVIPFFLYYECELMRTREHVINFSYISCNRSKIDRVHINKPYKISPFFKFQIYKRNGVRNYFSILKATFIYL